MNVTFRGVRLPDGSCDVSIIQDGQDMGRLPPRNDLRNHSPDGFEWGYCGSGPAQLALALCALLMPDALAVAVYQEVKRQLVAGLARQGWELPALAVVALANRIAAERLTSNAAERGCCQ